MKILFLAILICFYAGYAAANASERYEFRSKGIEGKIPKKWVRTTPIIGDVLIAVKVFEKKPKTQCAISFYPMPEFGQYTINELEKIIAQPKFRNSVVDQLLSAPLYRGGKYVYGPNREISGFPTLVIFGKWTINESKVFSVWGATTMFQGLVVNHCTGLRKRKRKIKSYFKLWTSSMFFQQSR